jgi:hypothetical protein
MTMFMLTIAGLLSILAMIRSVAVVSTGNFWEGVFLGVLGFLSFILTIILTNGVGP